MDHLVAPPTERLGTALNEQLLDVDQDGEQLRFEIEPVEFGVVFEEAHIDITPEVPEADSPSWNPTPATTARGAGVTASPSPAGRAATD